MALTPEDLAEIKKLIGATVVDTMKDALPAAVEAATKPLGERLSAAEKAAKERADAEAKAAADAKAAEEAKKNAGAGKPGELPPEVVARLKAMEDALKASEEKAKAAERAAAEDRAYGATKDALIKAGVPADRVQFALALVKTQGLVKFAEDGGHYFEGAEQYGTRPKITPDAWAAEFVKGAEGKALLPAVDARGTGGRALAGAGGGTPGVISTVEDFDKQMGFGPN